MTNTSILVVDVRFVEVCVDNGTVLVYLIKWPHSGLMATIKGHYSSYGIYHERASCIRLLYVDAWESLADKQSLLDINHSTMP